MANYREHKKRNEEKGNGFGFDPKDPERERVINSVTTNPYRNGSGNFIVVPKARAKGNLASSNLAVSTRTVISTS